MCYLYALCDIVFETFKVEVKSHTSNRTCDHLNRTFLACSLFRIVSDIQNMTGLFRMMFVAATKLAEEATKPSHAVAVGNLIILKAVPNPSKNLSSRRGIKAAPWSCPSKRRRA